LGIKIYAEEYAKQFLQSHQETIELKTQEAHEEILSLFNEVRNHSFFFSVLVVIHCVFLVITRFGWIDAFLLHSTGCRARKQSRCPCQSTCIASHGNGRYCAFHTKFIYDSTSTGRCKILFRSFSFVNLFADVVCLSKDIGEEILQKEETLLVLYQE
jgi:hypothetical protein